MILSELGLQPRLDGWWRKRKNNVNVWGIAAENNVLTRLELPHLSVERFQIIQTARTPTMQYGSGQLMYLQYII